MNSQFNNSKSVIIENENKNNNELKNYGSINTNSNECNITDISNADNKGWLSKASNGVYSVGAGAVTYGYSGLKWALSTTTSVGSTVLSTGAAGVVKLKNRTSKDKNE